MDFFTYRISLDMNESTSQSFLNVRKSDSARKLLFTLSDNGKAYQIGSGCTAVFRAKKPDGTILYNNCSINGNVIEYEITNQTISAEGIVECEVTLYGDDGRQITSPRFNIVVNDTIYADDEVESQNEFTQLTQAILGANNLNIDVERSGEGTVITITKKDGTSEQVIVSKVFSLNVFVITETEVITNKTYAEIKAAIDAGDIICITDKNGVVYVPQVAKTGDKIEFLWLDSHEDRTYRWSAVVNSENTWSVTVPELATTDKLGNLSALKTQADDNLVVAINEVKQTADTKQDKLIAGENITIAADGKTISATGGGSTVELDTTLSETGKAADAKAVGDEIRSLSEEKVSLPKDDTGAVQNGADGQILQTNGDGTTQWVDKPEGVGGGAGIYVGDTAPSDTSMLWVDTSDNEGSTVDSVNGKTGTVVLTAEDVGAMPAGASVDYTLPVATAETLGGVKVGEGLSIDASGVLSASGGSSSGGGGGVPTWSLLGEYDMSTIADSTNISLTGLDNLTYLYFKWEALQNETSTDSNYWLSINGKQLGQYILSRKSGTSNYGYTICKWNGLVWEIQMSAGAISDTNYTLSTVNALFPYNHVFGVGACTTLSAFVANSTYKPVSGVLKIYGGK